MFDYNKFEVWFVTGSQHLYGAEALKQVAANAQEISKALSNSSSIPTPIVFKPVVTTPEAIYELCQAANSDKKCVGLILWMHTFSPAKMWIAGLAALQKPFLHNTQPSLRRCSQPDFLSRPQRGAVRNRRRKSAERAQRVLEWLVQRLPKSG